MMSNRAKMPSRIRRGSIRDGKMNENNMFESRRGFVADGPAMESARSIAKCNFNEISSRMNPRWIRDGILTHVNFTSQIEKRITNQCFTPSRHKSIQSAMEYLRVRKSLDIPSRARIYWVVIQIDNNIIEIGEKKSSRARQPYARDGKMNDNNKIQPQKRAIAVAGSKIRDGIVIDIITFSIAAFSPYYVRVCVGVYINTPTPPPL